MEGVGTDDITSLSVSAASQRRQLVLLVNARRLSTSATVSFVVSITLSSASNFTSSEGPHALTVPYILSAFGGGSARFCALA